MCNLIAPLKRTLNSANNKREVLNFAVFVWLSLYILLELRLPSKLG
jgi:hypothetical protein